MSIVAPGLRFGAHQRPPEPPATDILAAKGWPAKAASPKGKAEPGAKTMTNATRRKANIRLAIIIGLLALGIYFGFIFLSTT